MGALRLACGLLPFLVATGAGAPVINEFVPRPGGEEGEWIELLNPGPEAVNVQGWAIRDGTGKARGIAGSTPLLPGQLLVLAARPESLRAAYALDDTVLVRRPLGWPVLNDRDPGKGLPADVIVLLDAAGVTVDSVAYFEDWLPREAGRSLERADVHGPGTAAGTWGWSVDALGGTPGRANSLSTPERREDRGMWIGPEFVSPETQPARFRYRLPEPGTMAVSLVDEAGRILKVLQPPRPSGSVGQWIWGAGAYVPSHSGDFYLCLLWQGPDGHPLRTCRRVWVSR